MITANRKVLIGVVLVVILLAAGVVAWLWTRPASQVDNSTDQSQAEKPDSDKDTSTPQVDRLTSAKGVEVRLDNISSGLTVSSPLTVTGEVPGSWSHEGAFTITLSYGDDDSVLVESSASLDGDWMTEEMVPFSALLEFTLPDDVTEGALTLHRANPSGLAENDDSVSIPVKF